MTLAQLLAIAVQVVQTAEPGIVNLLKVIAAQELAAAQARFLAMCLDEIIVPLIEAQPPGEVLTPAELRTAAWNAVVAFAQDEAAAGVDITAETLAQAQALITHANPPAVGGPT